MINNKCKYIYQCRLLCYMTQQLQPTKIAIQNLVFFSTDKISGNFFNNNIAIAILRYGIEVYISVSYTHLTLPTIYSV